MIRNDREHQETLERLKSAKARFSEQQAHLEEMGLTPAELKRAMDPLRSFYLQMEEEVEEYERLKRGDLEPIENMEGLGRMLVGLRIAEGLTQRELAERLGVDESQVSRDERNEYRGIAVERAARILEALHVTMTSVFERSHRKRKSTFRSVTKKKIFGSKKGRAAAGR
jgi:DNA-binding XRE family transcriptional regulator